ncbi:uncharacterized protein LOC143986622 [Lithobates pipiens]
MWTRSLPVSCDRLTELKKEESHCPSHKSITNLKIASSNYINCIFVPSQRLRKVEDSQITRSSATDNSPELRSKLCRSAKGDRLACWTAKGHLEFGEPCSGCFMMFQENTEQLKTEAYAEGLLSSQVAMAQRISCIHVSDINQGLQCKDSLNDAFTSMDGHEEHSALKEDQEIPADQKLPQLPHEFVITMCVHCLINQYRELHQLKEASERKEATMGPQEKNALSKEYNLNSYLFHNFQEVKNGSHADHVTPECNRLLVMKVIFALCLLWTLLLIFHCI